MHVRSATRLAWLLSATSLGLVATALLAFRPLGATSWAAVTIAISTAAVGGPVAARRPRNPVGWLLSAWGAEVSFYVFAAQYAHFTLVSHPGALPGGNWLAWAASSLWHAAFICFVAMFLVFPHGRLLSRRWRPVLWLAIADYAGIAATGLGWSSALAEHFPFARPPFTPLPGAGVAATAFGVLLMTNLAFVLLAVASLA
ncbi:MAG: hypothetical protein LC640_10675, partial [Frankia sp.]|nr:hypothetical protein [Frankia sp.]